MYFVLQFMIAIWILCTYCESVEKLDNVVNVIEAVEWNITIVLCDNEFGNECIVEEGNVSRFPFSHVFIIKDLSNTSELIKVFESTDQLSQLNWLVFCSDCLPLLSVINEYEFSHNLQGYFTHLYQWIFVTNFTKARSEFENKVDNITNLAVLDVNTNFSAYTAMFGNENRYFDLVSKSSQLQQLGKTDIFPNLKYGLNGITLRFATLPWSPYIIIYENGTYSGYYIELLNIIAQHMNFSVTMHQPLDGKYGIKKNGEWNGMIRELIDKKTDIVAVLTYSADRGEVVDMPATAADTDYGLIMYHAERPTQMSIALLTKPFSQSVWLCLLGLTLIASMAFVAAQRWGKYGPEDIAFAQCSFIFQSSMKQASHIILQCPSSRLIYSVYALGFIIVLALYTAQLVALLSVQQINVPFRTILEVAENTEYMLGTTGGTLAYDLNVQKNFTPGTVSDKLKSEMLRDADVDPTVFSPQHVDHLEKLEKENYAFYSTLSDYESIAQTSCSVSPLQERGFLIFNGYMLQKNSAYTKYIDRTLLQIQEGDLNKPIRKTFWPKPKDCIQEFDSVVRLPNVIGIFYILFAGLFIAFLALLLELIVHRTREYRHIIRNRTHEKIGNRTQEWRTRRAIPTRGLRRQRHEFESNRLRMPVISRIAVKPLGLTSTTSLS